MTYEIVGRIRDDHARVLKQIQLLEGSLTRLLKRFLEEQRDDREVRSRVDAFAGLPEEKLSIRMKVEEELLFPFLSPDPLVDRLLGEHECSEGTSPSLGRKGGLRER